MPDDWPSPLAQRALIVDSDADDGALIADTVRALGYEAILTSDFRSFRAAYESTTSILVIDLETPDLDGIEILRILAARECRAGIIVAGQSDPKILEAAVRLAQAKKLWVIGGLEKPIDRERLEQMLQQAKPAVRERTRQIQAVLDPEDLKKAIEGDELVVYFQPKINLETLEFKAAEALVRWNHPKHGLVGPERFIRLAEMTGLIDPLTERVMRLSFEQYNRWKEKGLTVKVSINLSALSLHNLELPDRVIALAREYDVDPDHIVLEITESTLSDDSVAALDVLTRLRLKGFDLSIDDFGSGYSNMRQLKDIPFTELKLDRHFVTGATEKPSQAIISSSIELGRELDLRVVAEGIETEDDWELISKLGCDEGQGFFIATPMPGDEVLAWLQHWNKQLGKD